MKMKSSLLKRLKSLTKWLIKWLIKCEKAQWMSPSGGIKGFL